MGNSAGGVDLCHRNWQVNMVECLTPIPRSKEMKALNQVVTRFRSSRAFLEGQRVSRCSRTKKHGWLFDMVPWKWPS